LSNTPTLQLREWSKVSSSLYTHPICEEETGFTPDQPNAERLNAQRLSPRNRVQTRPVPYVVTEPCIGVKDKSCMTVCPVDCIYEADDMVYIHPDECIDCGLCEPECPVTAIFVDTDVPANWKDYIEKNRIESKRISGHD
jgi:ferredoxin